MSPSLADQTVVVTGASSGIGRALARELGSRRARVGLLARNFEGLAAAADEVRERGGSAICVPTDVSDDAAVEAAATRVEQELGPIDTWVNNAMVTVFAPVMRMTAAEYRRVTEVTYLGYVHGTQTALRRMLPRDQGTIVQIGSALAYRSIPLQSAYCASKAAIRGFTASLRTELLHDGSAVRVSMVELPAVNTPQFVVQRNKLDRAAQPVPPIFAPELIAEMILWAIEHAPRELIVGESALQAILGQKIAPGILDRYLAWTGYDSQQTDEPNDPARPNNLFGPLPGDHGMRGPFTDRSHHRSLQMWLATHPWTARTVAIAGAAAFALWLRRS